MKKEEMEKFNWAEFAKTMNDYSQYDPDYCDGHECIADCERCRYRKELRDE